MHGEITFIILPAHSNGTSNQTQAFNGAEVDPGVIKHIRALFDYDPDVRFHNISFSQNIAITSGRHVRAMS